MDPATGRVAPLYQNALAWVITYHGVQAASSGSPVGSDGKRPVERVYTTDDITIIDGSTGEVLMSILDTPDA